MNSEGVRVRMQEFSNLREEARGDEAALLEVALFVEDIFGIILSDEEICEENLGTHQVTEDFILKKLGLR